MKGEDITSLDGFTAGTGQTFHAARTFCRRPHINVFPVVTGAVPAAKQHQRLFHAHLLHVLNHFSYLVKRGVYTLVTIQHRF